MLTRDLILAADDLPRERVDVPEWGDFVFVRGMNGAERDSWETELAKAGKDDEVDSVAAGADASSSFRASVLVRCFCDDKGDRLFADADAAALGKKSGKALDRAFDIARRLSGIGLGAEDDAVKNSVPARSADSSSASR